MNCKLIGVLDYDSGNLLSVRKAIESIGHNVELIDVSSDSPSELSRFDTVVLPGVGAFGSAMDKLDKSGFVEPLKDAAASGQPIVGICLGMQLLFESSTEFGMHEGLSMIKGSINHLSTHLSGIRVPNIGWCKLQGTSNQSEESVISGQYGYFVHSFYATNVDDDNIIAVTEYMGCTVPAIVCNDNVIGFQYHPEKSGPGGLALLKRFL